MKKFYKETDYNVFKIQPRDNDERDADELFNEFINSNLDQKYCKSHIGWAIRVYESDKGCYVVLSNRGEKLEEGGYVWNHYIYPHNSLKDAINVARLFHQNAQNVAEQQKGIMLNGKGTNKTSSIQD